jgi:L-lactate dehydrogenase complex protein LldG
MSSRDEILGKLKAARQPFGDIPPIENRQHMVVMQDVSPEALQKRFVEEARKLGCRLVELESPQAGNDYIVEILGNDKKVLAWDFDHIPLPDLPQEFAKAGVSVAPPDDHQVRVGVTGVNAAIASTGSILLTSGKGQPRSASLLPYIHIAIVRKDQLVADLETWMAAQKIHDLRGIANVSIISGASRTADIAMELVMGAHGPAELHIILV